MIEPSDCQLRALRTDALPAAASETHGDVSHRMAGAPSMGVDLPTRQRNALRHLLDQATITPADVARLSYRTLERAPGVGKQSIGIIIAWLRAHGLEPAGQPTLTANPRVLQRQRKLERAISLLRENGYEVHQGD